MSEEEIAYQKAFKLYEEGCYKDASSVFFTLALKDPLEECYWRGLASSRQMERKFEAALHAWAIVAILVSKDAWPHFHAAECLFALRDTFEAKKALLLAEEKLKETDPLYEKIQSLKEHYAIAEN